MNKFPILMDDETDSSDDNMSVDGEDAVVENWETQAGDKIEFCTSVMSLKNQATMKLAITLWSDKSIMYKLIDAFDTFNSDTEYVLFKQARKRIEKEIYNKIDQLPLPTDLRTSLKDVADYIGKEISRWVYFHDKYIFDKETTVNSKANEYIENILWNSQGSIDYGATIENLIRRNALNNDEKFKAACRFCSEERVGALCNSVTSSFWFAHDETRESCVISYWLDQMKQNVTLRDFYDDEEFYTFEEEILIEDESVIYNDLGRKYFWSKLNESQQLRVACNWLDTVEYDNPARYFVLLQANAKQQRSIFKDCPYQIVHTLIADWQLTEYSVLILRRILNILTDKGYYELMKCIAKEMIKSNTGYKYERYLYVLRQIITLAPRHFQGYISRHKKGKALVLLLESVRWDANEELVEMLLQPVTETDRKAMLCSEYGKNLCFRLILYYELRFVRKFIEGTFTDKEVENFNQNLFKLKMNGREIVTFFISRAQWSQLDAFIKWAFADPEKLANLKAELPRVKIFKELLKKTFLNEVEDERMFHKYIVRDEVSFSNLDNFLNWFFGTEEEKKSFKSEFIDADRMQLLNVLLKQNCYELVRAFLNWIFMNNQEDIARFRDRFFNRNIALI